MSYILLLLVLFLIVILIILITFAWGGILAAPWVPIRRKDVSRILKLAEIKPNETLVDLGSGDGRIIINAAKKYNIKTIGFEVAVLLYILCWIKILVLGLKNQVRVNYSDFYKYNLDQADIVTTFLSPWAMKKLKPKFKRELKSGARVVSYAFKIPDWEPKIIDRPTSKDLPIYVYEV